MAVERKLITAEELLLLPDDGMRHELIDGELRTMSPGGGPHGRDGMRVSVSVATHVYANDLGECFAAETGFLFRRNPDRVRAPDFAFIRADRMPAGSLPRGYIPIPPDMVLEVVSPGDSATDVRDKVEEWLAFGCRAVWVLFDGPRLDVHLGDRMIRSYGPDDEVDGGDVLPGFRMKLRNLVRGWAD
ncbi:MAG TPA: Uma2 family endonuclease [Chloroflexota bacterium]|nr:Uma2 family endonuclease [Chloroflexota bacterium]